MGGSQTTDLLAHEKFHYDVGFVVARVVARELMTLRAGDEPELPTAVWNTVRLDFLFSGRADPTSLRLGYKRRTVRYDQQVWFSRMSRCLADPASRQIGGFWL